MIRYLQPGEPIPPGEPKRYPDPRGYVRLRWKVGTDSYVEAWEHRVITAATSAEVVHHKNRVTGDNQPDNLEVLNRTTHIRKHWVEASADERQRITSPAHDAVRAKSHCRRGHEYTPENTRIHPSRGHRECLTCLRARERKRYSAEPHNWDEHMEKADMEYHRG